MGDSSPSAVDFAFLSTQTFTDLALEREVLELFVEQARRLIADLPLRSPQEQADVAHLLKGSARGIGAWAAADAAERYEQAAPAARGKSFVDLQEAFAQAEAAIAGRLTTLGDG